MTEDSCLRILTQAAKMGVKEVAFSGGEPLVWPHVAAAVEKAEQLGFQISLYTSGNIDKQGATLRGLSRLGLTRVVFSMFGASEESHERVTRIRGSLQRTIDAIEEAKKAGLETEIHFVPMAHTFTELPGIAEVAKRLGVTRISVLRFVPQGRGHLIRRHVLSKVQNLRLKKMIEELRGNGIEIRTGSPYNFLLLNQQPACCSGVDRLIIGPELKAYPCDAFKQVEAEELVGSGEFSSLAECSLQECWDKSPYLNAVRTYLTTPFSEPCGSCEMLEKCLSGCLAQKALAHGDLKKRPDPMCLHGRAAK
jgi:pyrroloquinoline quinone biosynthesis protein E